MAGETATRSYSRKTRLKAERLYLANGLSPKEIAAKLGITAQAVSNLAYKHGWAEKRRRRESQALAHAEDRVSAVALDFVESVALQSQELAEKGFKLAREVSGEDREKNFAMAMKGTQIAVQLARQAMGIDAKSGPGTRDGAAMLVFCRFGDATEKRAEPVEVEARNAEEITLEFEPSEPGKSESISNNLQNFERSAAIHNSASDTQKAS